MRAEDNGRRLIGNLSKGYQQRVGIAQAIIHDPPVVILDEPTVGLDPIQIREIRDLIRSLGSERSVILSTHILSEVQATCDRVQIIRAGELIYNASTESLNQRHEVSFSVALRKAVTSRTDGDRGRRARRSARRWALSADVCRDATPDALVASAVQRQWGLMN